MERRRLFARMWRNALHVAGGNAAAVGIGMATLAVSTQMLGPALLGVLAMIESYGRLIDQIFRFETWQAVVRYGATALEQSDRERLKRLIKLGMIIDISGALIGATIAFLLVPLVGEWFGWDESAMHMAKFYCIVLAFGISSTPIGVLRLFDHFAQVAWIPSLLAVIRLLGTLAIWMLGGSLWPLIILVVALLCAEQLSMAYLAWRTLRRNGFTLVLRTPLVGATQSFPDIKSFIVAANGTVLIRKSTQEFDILLVGHVGGLEAAGVYQVVRKLALAAAKAAGMIQQVVYPDLARLWARKDYGGFYHAVRRIELITILFGLAVTTAFMTAGDHIIRLIAGDHFQAAVLPLVVHSIAMMLFVSGSALRPALMVTGHQTKMLSIVAASAAVFYIALFVAVPALGIVGASLAHVAFSLVWLPASMLLFGSVKRRAIAEQNARSA